MSREDDMRLAVILALALAAFGAADAASARGKPAGTGKGPVAQPHRPIPPGKGQTTKGIIMQEGTICNPRWGC
jgi:hypothetical protein